MCTVYGAMKHLEVFEHLEVFIHHCHNFLRSRSRISYITVQNIHMFWTVFDVYCTNTVQILYIQHSPALTSGAPMPRASSPACFLSCSREDA